MDPKYRDYLWDALGLIGAAVVIAAILNPEFWQALYRIIIAVAAIAFVAGIGIGAAGRTSKLRYRSVRRRSRIAVEAM